MATVLVIEDDAEIRILLATALRSTGHTALVASTGRAGLDLARNAGVDLLIVDLTLPDIAGAEVVESLKTDALTRTIPIIILSGRVEESDRLNGFELGADDYVTKPFSVRELMMRTRVALRRCGRDLSAERTIVDVDLRIDTDRRRVYVHEQEIALTPTELKLLAALAGRPGHVHSRQSLLAEVWGMQPDLETRTVDVHVKRLREKLGVVGARIQTVRGVGYRMCVAEEQQTRDAVG